MENKKLDKFNMKYPVIVFHDKIPKEIPYIAYIPYFLCNFAGISVLSVAAKRQKAVWLDCCRACRKRTDFYLFSQLYRIFVDRNLSDAGAVF